jgi:hypothetical protein
MTFGAMLRAYGRLATFSSRLPGDQRAAKKRQLNANAEELLQGLSARLIAAKTQAASKTKLLQPTSMCTNMIYDTGPRPKG